MFSLLYFSNNHVLSRESPPVQPGSGSCICPTTTFCLVNLHLYNHVQSLVFFLQQCSRRVTLNYAKLFAHFLKNCTCLWYNISNYVRLSSSLYNYMRSCRVSCIGPTVQPCPVSCFSPTTMFCLLFSSYNYIRLLYSF
jgi:hypothetical protein